MPTRRVDEPSHRNPGALASSNVTRYYVVVIRSFRDPNAEVRGLTAFARENWPPIPPVHLGFQVMVGLGTAMALVSLWAIIVTLQKGVTARHRWLLRALAIVAPFGFIAT